MTTTISFVPATERQIAFLTSLLEQESRRYQQIDPDNGPEFALANREWIDDLLTGRYVMAKSDASRSIERVKTWLADNPAPHEARGNDRPAVAGRPQVTEGLYIKDGTVYRVQRSKTGNLYAKRLVPNGRKGQFVYAPGVTRTLTADDVLTAERAAEFGRVQVFCACCGLELDTEESRARGIGPVCFRRHFA
jgi:hypothetical protein